MRADDDELLEVFRLGEATGLGEITTTVVSRLAGRWLGVSRSREVATLMGRALHIEASPVVMNYAGRAAENLGYRGSALTHYEEALPLIRAVQDHAGEATTLTNIGAVHRAGRPRRRAHLLRAGPAPTPGRRGPHPRSGHPVQHRGRPRRAGRPRPR